MITVMELPVRGNVFVDQNGNEYVLAHVCDDGDTYAVLVDVDMGLAFRHFKVMRAPS